MSAKWPDTKAICAWHDRYLTAEAENVRLRAERDAARQAHEDADAALQSLMAQYDPEAERETLEHAARHGWDEYMRALPQLKRVPCQHCRAALSSFPRQETERDLFDGCRKCGSGLAFAGYPIASCVGCGLFESKCTCEPAFPERTEPCATCQGRRWITKREEKGMTQALSNVACPDCGEPAERRQS